MAGDGRRTRSRRRALVAASLVAAAAWFATARWGTAAAEAARLGEYDAALPAVSVEAATASWVRQFWADATAPLPLLVRTKHGYARGPLWGAGGTDWSLSVFGLRVRLLRTSEWIS